MARDTETIGRSPLWQIVIIILSVYVLIALFLSVIIPLSPATRELLNIIDTIICVIFIGDFIYMLAVNGRDYLRWGWIDLVSSIPAIEFLRWGRLFRVFRVMRVLRGFRSVKVLFRYLYRNRAQSVLLTVVLMALTSWIFASYAILNVEIAPDSTITNAGDAMWWAFVTLTGGEPASLVPATLEGRMIAMFLSLTGMILVGTFTAYVTALFVASGARGSGTS